MSDERNQQLYKDVMEHLNTAFTYCRFRHHDWNKLKEDYFVILILNKNVLLTLKAAFDVDPLFV